MTLRHGLVVQWEVLSSLIVRETRTRYGNSRLGYFWALFMPILGIGFFYGLLFLGRAPPPAGMDPVSFLTTGFLGYHVVTDALDQSANALGGNGALFVYPQVRPLDMVIARVPEEYRMFAARRRYLPANVPLVKSVAAISGDEVCAAGARVRVNGRLVVRRLDRDGAGRPMPWWSGCTELGTGEVFLLMTDSRASFDGRYFGVSEAGDIVGKARLIWRR